jgi:hypothetical protein
VLLNGIQKYNIHSGGCRRENAQQPRQSGKYREIRQILDLNATRGGIYQDFLFKKILCPTFAMTDM